MKNKTIIAFTYDFDRTLSPVDMPDNKLTPYMFGNDAIKTVLHDNAKTGQAYYKIP